ncbi:hypothetical protein, partial [Curtobacterium poinsettiae]|uniref:hypothetical protein n=1 Tax=Curtobacterium poinsettiae TaxID=159612 RepID=UPI0023617562
MTIIVTAPIPDDGSPAAPAIFTVRNVPADVAPSSTRAFEGIGTYCPPVPVTTACADVGCDTTTNNEPSRATNATTASITPRTRPDHDAANTLKKPLLRLLQLTSPCDGAVQPHSTLRSFAHACSPTSGGR